MSTTAASAMKMTRMKSFVRKWQSLSRVEKVHTYYESYDMDMATDEIDDISNLEAEESYNQHGLETIPGWINEGRQQYDVGSHATPVSLSSSQSSSIIPEGSAVVFVGRARRQYAVHARHLQHPLFKALQQRSETSGINQSLGLTLGCEIVLFEHLLWMLESDDPALQSADSVHELAELYMPSDGSSNMLHLLHQD
ncbi:hypothetical protein L7F22_005132 [Adiantum nelumboides]|nr:hypothetical protein [Adiantum nelumboides]